MRLIDSESRILFARNTRQIVVWVVTVLAIVFTGVQIKDISPPDFVHPIASSIMWRGALIAYFWCWRYGCIRDTDIQELAYAYLPDGGRWRWKSYLIVLILVALAAGLVWSYGNMEAFAIVITLFFLADHVGWRYLVNELKPYGVKSGGKFTREQNYFAMERLRVVTNQIDGQWKWWRSFFGGLIILSIDAFAFISKLRELAVVQVMALQPNISVVDAEVFVFSFLVFLFVVVMEVWHYLIRLRTKFWLQYIEELKGKYNLRPIP